MCPRRGYIGALGLVRLTPLRVCAEAGAGSLALAQARQFAIASFIEVLKNRDIQANTDGATGGCAGFFAEYLWREGKYEKFRLMLGTVLVMESLRP